CAVETYALLLGFRARCVQHRQIDVRAGGRDVAEPRRQVLDRVRLDDRQPNHAAHLFSTSASLPASAHADVGSSARASIASAAYRGSAARPANAARIAA